MLVFMKSIDHLPEEEKQYYIQCEGCGEFVDKRDLGQVFEHWDCGLPKQAAKSTPTWSKSKKVGDSKEFLNDDTKTKLDLN